MKWDLEAGFGRGKCGWRCEVDAKVGRVDVASGGGRWTRVVEDPLGGLRPPEPVGANL